MTNGKCRMIYDQMIKVFLVTLLLFVLGVSFPSAQTPKPSARNWKRVEFRVRPFTDLYFYLYKLSSSSEKEEVNIEGFSQAVAAAGQVPVTLIPTELIPFRFDNAADASKVLAQSPETYKTRSGETIPLRERSVRFGQSLIAVEKPFMDEIWPKHKLLVDQTLAKLDRMFGPKEEESFNYLTRHLGLEKAEFIVPVYLVAKAHVSGVTMWGKDETRGFCVLSVTALQDSQLITAILHEAIHALDLETKGKGNVLVDLQQRLLKAGFAADDLLVRHGPHMLVFIQSSETVRRLIDPSYEPYGEGVFVRPALAPIAKVQLPLWNAYLDGKISRDEALTKMVDAFVKARPQP